MSSTGHAGVGTALNLGLVLMELLFGFLSNSLALISDGVHNFSDVLGLLLGRVDGFPQASDLGGTRIAFSLIHRVPAYWRAGNADRNARGGLGHGPDGV
ncbi:cation transporter [Methylocystis echinoides]|uniref:cation transporter n=1 Tax=Methylocystis echinoides TaxID=29468 RepID=UPI00248FB374|nr:cation transporter [Methylocystis echinoides]